MPLNNQVVVQQDDGTVRTETRMFKDVSYDLMVKVYDSNCANCGCSLYEVGDKLDSHYKEFKEFHKAVQYALSHKLSIYRTCDYPSDVEDALIYNPRLHTFINTEIRPSLQQIVSNTCRFWNEHNIEMDEEDEDIL